MAFSIDWFMTVPGILITVGVILLIIALIMFIVSSMKEKKGEAIPSVLSKGSDEDNTLPTGDTVSVVEEIIEPVVIEENIEQPVLIDSVSEEVVVPSFEGDNIIPVVEENDTANNVKENSFIPADLEEIVIPTAEVNDNNVIATENIASEISFEIPEPITEVEHRPIYGGADPLEATQNLPKVDVHREPYSGAPKEAVVRDVEETVVEEKEPVLIIEEPQNIPEIITIPEEEVL